MEWRESFTNPVFHIPLNLFLEITVVLGDAKTISSELFGARIMSILSHRTDNFKAMVGVSVSVFPFPTIAIDIQFSILIDFDELFTSDDHFVRNRITFS